MRTRELREPGEPLAPRERALLDLLCEGDGTRLAQAREQLVHARWGGYQHDDCDCFLISISESEDLPRIAHNGGPFSVVSVSRHGKGLGTLDLWVVDGTLHSVDYMTFEDDHDELPDPADHDLE